MTFQETLSSGAWEETDVLNGTERNNVRLGRGSHRAKFALYQWWAAQNDPELGDALIHVLCGPTMRPVWRKRWLDRMATVPVDFAAPPEPRMSRVRCKDCGETWKPEGRPWEVGKCRACGGRWIGIV